jgi:O-succinylbenzoate synthase
VELSVLRLPLVRPFETSFGRVAGREFVLVAVRDADGACGWGECVADADPYYSSETTTTAWHIMTKYLVPVILGRELDHPRDVARAWSRVRGHAMAKAAIEMAAWDLHARIEGRPLCELLGATARPIPAGVSIGIHPSIDALLERVAAELADGYRRIKIKIKPGWDKGPVEAIRARFGAVPLMVDANAAYTIEDAPTLAALDRADLMMIEQPLSYDDLVQHARLQEQIATPVCLDESITSPQVAADALDLGACRVINIKPGRMGGFSPSLAVHALARARGVPLWHGGMLESGIGRAHNLHLSTLPGFTLPGDVAASRRYFVPDLIEPPLEVRPDGCLDVPPGPGIGVTPVVERVRAATVHSEGFRAGLIAVAVAAATVAACGRPTAPPVVPGPTPPAPVTVPLDRKAAWVLRLEQQRVLRDPGVSPPARQGSTVSPAFVPATAPDLEALIVDPEAGLRRRAALAVGRVGLIEGVPILVRTLADPQEDVRAAAAFGLGLIGADAGADPLITALKDPSFLVRGRAAEGLGLIVDAIRTSGRPAEVLSELERRTSAAVADAASGCGERLASIEPDDEAVPKPPEIDLCRLSLFALVRMRQYDALARVALDAQGRPVSRWWPVAFALQRIGDPRAVPALLALSSSTGVYTPAFALRGLAAAKAREAAPLAHALIGRQSTDVRLRVAAVRALAQIGGAETVDRLLNVLVDPATPRNLALEVVIALGVLGDPRAFDVLLNGLTDPWPAMRAAVLTAASQVNPEGFVLVMSSTERDKDWSVRAALATAFAALSPDRVRGAIAELTGDADPRVRVPALEALARVGSPDLTKRLFDALDTADYAVRATAAQLLGNARPTGGVPRLSAAYSRGLSDAPYGARTAALDALAKYGTDDAKAAIRQALIDKEWAVRLRAAELLRSMGESGAAPERPAPLRQAPDFFESPKLLRPPFAPRAFVETRHGIIEIELNVVDSALTAQTFMELARAGFYNGIRVHRLVPHFVIQAGDPRGDGAGGAGYTIRDELSTLPYVRGTVGMALEWRDTGGSQFFITLSPQPHLDGKYTVFGRVVNGDALLDLIALGDVIERIRIWDGVSF